MKVVHFDKMFISIPIEDNETIENIENKLIEAVDSIKEGIVISYKIEIEEYDD